MLPKFPRGSEQIRCHSKYTCALFSQIYDGYYPNYFSVLLAILHKLNFFPRVRLTTVETLSPARLGNEPICDIFMKRPTLFGELQRLSG